MRKTWLIRILINECYSLLRRQKKYVSMETTEIPERKQPEKTDYSELYQAVSELKDELKLPVILYYAEDFSNQRNCRDFRNNRRCKCKSVWQEPVES